MLPGEAERGEQEPNPSRNIMEAFVEADSQVDWQPAKDPPHEVTPAPIAESPGLAASGAVCQHDQPREEKPQESEAALVPHEPRKDA